MNINSPDLETIFLKTETENKIKNKIGNQYQNQNFLLPVLKKLKTGVQNLKRNFFNRFQGGLKSIWNKIKYILS